MELHFFSGERRAKTCTFILLSFFIFSKILETVRKTIRTVSSLLKGLFLQYLQFLQIKLPGLLPNILAFSDILSTIAVGRH